MIDDKYMPEIITKENDASQAQAPTPALRKFSKKTILIASGAVFLLLITTVMLLLSMTQRTGTNPSDPDQKENRSQTANGSKTTEEDRKALIKSLSSVSNTLVYGAWRDQKSVITSVDLLSNKSTELASLPLNVKNVNVISPQQIVYIDQTDPNDHGKQVSVYQIKDKKIATSIKVSPGFGIDDFILSPNKEYMAIWEVSLSPGTSVLYGGRSRVYGVKLSQPNLKYLLYDEAATAPIHYPRAVLNNGRVFTDKFLPNDPNGGAGWAYGMSVSDFNGGNKKDIESMQEGSYGTQPSLSPDGKYLVFSGYDGTRGDGKAVKNGFRQALLTPTTVELLDTTTLTRRKLANLPNSDIYPSAEWGATANDVVIFGISKKETGTGLYAYDVLKQTKAEVKLPASEQASYSLVSRLAGNKMLIATVDDSASTLGNLGDEYSASLTRIYYYDSSSNHAVRVDTKDAYIQYITTLPSKYFQNVLGLTAQAEKGGGDPSQPNVTIIDLYSDKPTEKNLQLKTFLLKPALQTKREEQQSKPLPTPTPTKPPKSTTPFPTRKPFVLPKTINCRDLAREQCGNGWNSHDCVERRRKQLKAEGKCNQSPLYLYGTEGQSVQVQVLTTVYNDNPRYGAGYNVKLLENGEMLIGGNSYKAINYNYNSNLRRITAPTRGTVARRADIEKVLRSYAKKLGLNEKETADLVTVGKEKTASPYVFISYFDQKTSESILPLSFSPKPDNYLNVVFYFKQLSEEPNYTPQQPTVGKPLNRQGLTAVEISEIIE